MHTETLYTDPAHGLVFVWNRSLTVNVFSVTPGEGTRSEWHEIDVFSFSATSDDDKPTEAEVRRSCEAWAEAYADEMSVMLG